MSGIPLSIRAASSAVVVLALVAGGSGCTSALNAAALREALWDTGDHAAEVPPAEAEAAVAADGAQGEAVADPGDPVDAERRAAAVDEAVSRLARLGPLDPAAKATLVETLQRTAQEDWPVVVEAFAATLEAARPSTRTSATSAGDGRVEVEDAHVVAKADLDGAPAAALTPPLPPAAASGSSDAASPTTESRPAPAVEPAADAPASTAHAIPAVEAAPKLAVRNACFASRVQGWGVLDRFPSDDFRPGQEVIVYFELDNLSASESPTGHTTCIDTTLTLVDGRGSVVREWSFEPIAETCRSRRRDYFARYVVRLPAELQAGEYRLELAVIDTLAGIPARESLPLELLGPAAARD